MPTNTKVCTGFRSASRVVSESGREESATAAASAADTSGKAPPPPSKGDNPKSKSGGRESDSHDLHRGSLKTPLLRAVGEARIDDANYSHGSNFLMTQAFGELSIEFASNLLHALGRNAGRVRQNRELITAERCRTKNIDDVKCVLHEINLRVLPQALTTRST